MSYELRVTGYGLGVTGLGLGLGDYGWDIWVISKNVCYNQGIRSRVRSACKGLESMR